MPRTHARTHVLPPPFPPRPDPAPLHDSPPPANPCRRAACRFGPYALYVQPTDANHYNGKGFKNDDRSSARGQRKPPQRLIPHAEGGRDYMCRWVLSRSGRTQWTRAPS